MPADIQCRVLIQWPTVVRLHCPHCMGVYKRIGAVRFGYLTASYYTYIYSVVKVREPRALPFPPLTFGHSMPAIPYTSGRCSLPSGTGAEPVRPVAGWFGCLGSIGALASDDLKVSPGWFARQPPKPLALLMVWHSVHAAHPVMEPRTQAHAQVAQRQPLCQANLKSCKVPH